MSRIESSRVELRGILDGMNIEVILLANFKSIGGFAIHHIKIETAAWSCRKEFFILFTP